MIGYSCNQWPMLNYVQWGWKIHDYYKTCKWLANLQKKWIKTYMSHSNTHHLVYLLSHHEKVLHHSCNLFPFYILLVIQLNSWQACHFKGERTLWNTVLNSYQTMEDSWMGCQTCLCFSQLFSVCTLSCDMIEGLKHKQTWQLSQQMYILKQQQSKHS